MGEAPWYCGREHTQQMRMGNRGGEQERKTRTGGCNERAAFEQAPCHQCGDIQPAQGPLHRVRRGAAHC